MSPSPEIQRRALERMYAEDPSLREWPEDRVRNTFRFQATCLGIAQEDLGAVVLAKIRFPWLRRMACRLLRRRR